MRRLRNLRHLNKHFLIFVLTLLVLGSSGCERRGVTTAVGTADTQYYGVKVDGVLCGYLERSSGTTEKNGRKMNLVEQNLFLMQTLLGSRFNTDMRILFYEDPDTGRCGDFSVTVLQGDVKRRSRVQLKGDTAFITSFVGGETTIKMTPDILFGDGELFRHVRKDFADPQTKEKTYRTLDAMDGQVRDVVFTKLGEETVESMGKSVETVVFNQEITATGVKVKLWYDLENLDMVKLKVSNREVFRTDHTVADKIKVADMNKDILTKTNVTIADIQGINYMKVKARIEPTGVQLTSADLNVPGQRFTGTVEKNVIDGVFEIAHPRYTGENAPPFPPDFSGDPALKKYLGNEGMIEADDPVLIAKAEEITAGSADSWEAARRVTQWVAENITYAIPGGGTARKTYDMRAGECGAHSFLTAAFCRAVGIPARVVWGAMYTPNYGGGFGQHGWNEIYMGDAGWITVDSTAFETDFVDSGHIRMGEYQSISTRLNGKAFEILAHKPGAAAPAKTDAAPTQWDKYTGSYKGPRGREFTVKTANGALVLMTPPPSSAALSFGEPDENGRRHCPIAPHIYIVFQEDGAGNVTAVDLHQTFKLPRKAGLTDAGVPDDFKPYLGEYYFAAAGVNIKIAYKGGALQLYNPSDKEAETLNAAFETDRFTDRHDRRYFFEKDGEGAVTVLHVDIPDKLKRIN